MFEDLDPQMREEGDHKAKYSSHTSLEHLLLAVAENCYICSEIYGQLQDENEIRLLSIGDIGQFEATPLLLRRGWRNLTGIVGAEISRYRPSRDELGDVTPWQYRLIPASRKEGDFGFTFVATGSGGTRAVHHLYENIPSSTCSQEVAKLVRLWYQRCQNGHKGCLDTRPWILKGTAMSGGVRHGTTGPNGDPVWKWYPPRLLDISSNPIRLVTRKGFQQCPAFAALSHCWGQEPFLTLTTNNLERFQKDGFDYANMPENFRNVVDIVRWLNIRYVWIDSLCIIQSGPEAQADCNEHADSMQYVYTSCNICISTAAADAATKPCFRERNPARISPVCVMVDGEPNLLIGKHHALRGFRNAPIASRAWVLQERLLARRILTLGSSQVFWECHETAGLNVCETFPNGLLAYGDSRGPFALPPNEQWPRPEHLDPSRLPSAEDQLKWLDLIETYSECQLTRCHEDKFVAFAGIVMHMHSVFGGHPYIAGFFKFELPAALLWHVRQHMEPESRPTPPIGFYRAPSWSWAATDARITCQKSRLHAERAEPPEPVAYFATLIEHHVEVVNARFGQLSMAALNLQAPLIPMTWSGKFPTSTYDLEHVYYEMPDIVHIETGHSFFFDTQDDFDGTQEDVCFMPIISFEKTGHVEGLIVRPTALPASTATEVEMRCYMRIGMAIIHGDDCLVNVKGMDTQDIVLL